MHAIDKVQWQQWGGQVFEQAKKQNKPVYLTIGYYSCYWCHVLQEQSFLNDDVAAYINKHFIPVVIDRELHPVLDSRLSHFAEQTIGRAGWPLNVVLTPDGYPFMATIYQPQKQFLSWFKKVNGLWQTDPQYIRDISADAALEMNYGFKPKKSVLDLKSTEQISRTFVAEILSAADEFEGGFGDQAKFPLPAILNIVLEIYQQTKNEQLADFLNLTLTKMATQGLYDQLLGGFFRYTTDPGWQIPHFEKMLYDNAQIASLYLRAGKIFSDRKLTEIGKQTVDFILTHMQSKQGAFYSSFSAVDEHALEGGYYLWSKEDWLKMLDQEEQDIVSHAWGWGDNGILPEGYLPVMAMNAEMLSRKLKLSPGKIESKIKAIKSKFLHVRKSRKLPRDEKLLVSWNALTLLALIDAYKISKQQKYYTSAQKLAGFLLLDMYSNGVLYRSRHQDVLAGNASLEDYVYTAKALYEFYLLSKNPKIVKTVRSLTQYAWDNFFSDQGWMKSNNLLIPYGSAEALLADGPLPSASAMLIGLSLEPEMQMFKNKAILALQFGHGIQKDRPFWFASHVMLLRSATLHQSKR